MVVMVIMTLLAGLAVPSFVGSLREERLRTAGRVVVATVQLARGRAASEATPTRLEVDTRTNTISVTRLPDPTVEDPQWETMTDNLAEPKKLLDGVSISYVGKDPSRGEAQSVDYVEFQPDGSADANYIVLRGYGPSVVVVRVDELRFSPRVLNMTDAMQLNTLEPLP
jgi:Tfp pilus assembly protein FimT